MRWSLEIAGSTGSLHWTWPGKHICHFERHVTYSDLLVWILLTLFVSRKARNHTFTEQRNQIPLFYVFQETAALNEQTSSREILIPANSSNVAGAKAAQEMEKREEGLPPKHLKQQRGHRRQHKTNRHHGKHHHYRHRHQTLLTRHSVPNRSASDPGQHYARAYKANNSRQIKTAKIVQPTGTDSTTSEQVTRSSAVPTQTTTGMYLIYLI